MTQKMINSAKQSKFPMPVLLFLVVAFGINLLGDFLGGNLAVAILNRFHPGADASNRLLLMFAALNALPVFLFVKFAECRNIKDIGFYKETLAKDAMIGALAGFAAFAAIVGAGYALHVVSYQSANFTFANVINVLLMIPFWIIQAGVEEILTRGWVLPVVSAKSGSLTGILVSSALFVALHINNAGLNAAAVINIFLIGVLLALYTLKSDNLWGAIMFHAFWNFTQGSFFGLSVSGGSSTSPNLMNFVSEGNALLSGGKFGMEASILNTILIVLLLGMLLLTDRSRLLRSLFEKLGNETSEK